MTVPRRVYVLDTSVLLSAPYALTTFAEHEVVIPLVVLKELEGKRGDPELGWAARTVLRTLEGWRTAGGSLTAGVPVNEEGGVVRVELNHVDKSGLPEAVRLDGSNDTRILAVANALSGEGRDVTLVSRDLPLRLVASVTCGLDAEDYLFDQSDPDDVPGMVEVDVPSTLLDDLFAGEVVKAAEVESVCGVQGLVVNTGVVLRAGSSSGLATVAPSGGLRLLRPDLEAFGVRPRSAGQRFALQHLLDPQIGVVSLGGAAGTGKSLLALAAALEQVVEQRAFERVLVFRPLHAVGGQDLGYLPGSVDEKMEPWAAAVFDTLRAMVGDNVVDEVTDRGLLEVLPLTHIRGRTFTRSVVLVDECQNLERSTILAAVSRLGEGSRMTLLHDVAQRDNLRVGRRDGIAAVVGRLAGEPLFAHVTLTKSERSPVADLAARLLDF